MTPNQTKRLAGLDSGEAAARLKAYGPNEIQEDRGTPQWILFAHQFKSSLVILLLLACLLSVVLGEMAEAAAILAILLLNALIGFFQERKAENAIAALKQMTAPRARVLRDGRRMQVSAREVVPGDVLLLEAGDLIAADARVIESARLEVNEAVLTGESLPVEKGPDGPVEGPLADRSGFVFMGTAVAAGRAEAEVTATGMRTELGKIARLVSSASTSATPLQIQLQQMGRSLLYVCLAVVLVVAVLGLLEGRGWSEVLIFSVSLAVAAVPEGMPAIVTVALALGVQRMAARNALVRKLPSVETLGSVTVICTDKTGTLTTGAMRVRELWAEDHHELLKAAASCCDSELESGDIGDPTELAILLAARERGIERAAIERDNPRAVSYPFDADRKRMSVFRRDGTLYVKGALESLLAAADAYEDARAAIQKANKDMTKYGLRVLAVATGRENRERNLRLLGLIGMADPPRSEVMDAIQEARAAGIVPVMITGDHPVTAAAIARELGLVIEGENPEGRIHARATPEDKLLLVRQWKEKGAVVAMTGDGVNDAPALKEAHIGIAMGKTGTEVTRQSADIILADDNFATIVAAVREGRTIYQNVRKAILYLLTGNFGELLVVLGAMALALPLPLHAAHLLWINLVTDSLPGLALIADPVSRDVMKRPPRPRSELLLGKSEWLHLFWIGALEAAVVLALYRGVLNDGEDRARALAFSVFVFSQLWRAFGARSRARTFWEVGIMSNVWLLFTVAVTGVLQLALHFVPVSQKVLKLVPLDTRDIVLVLGLSLITVTTVELTKLAGRMFRRRHKEDP